MPIGNLLRGVCAAASAALMLISTSAAFAIVGGYEPPDWDTRFDAVCAIGKTNKLNGIGGEHNTFGNATLVTPDRVLLVKHLLLDYNQPDFVPPEPGKYTCRFRRKPDGSIGSKEEGWESFHQVRIMGWEIPAGTEGDDSLILGILEEPVTHIEPIPMRLNHALDSGDPIIVAGWGLEGPGPGEGDKGRLLLVDKLVNNETVQTITWPDGWNPDTNPCLCGTNLYDSGAAVLAECNGEIRIVACVFTTGGGLNTRYFHEYPEFEMPVWDPLPGDTNRDGVIDFLDLEGVLYAYTVEPEPVGACDVIGDVNSDSIIDLNDINLVLDGLMLDEWPIEE